MAAQPRYGTAFLDRDGTLTVEPAHNAYVRVPEQVRLLPGVGDGVHRLNEANVRVVVVSNQRGVGRGVMTAAELEAVHRRLVDSLAEHRAHLDSTYYCRHDVGECECRKPMPGLLLQAAREDPGVDLARAVLIGNEETDVEAAAAAGVPAVLIADAAVHSKAMYVVPDFAAAVAIVLGDAA